jgi:hypothetical protein
MRPARPVYDPAHLSTGHPELVCQDSLYFALTHSSSNLPHYGLSEHRHPVVLSARTRTIPMLVSLILDMRPTRQIIRTVNSLPEHTVTNFLTRQRRGKEGICHKLVDLQGDRVRHARPTRTDHVISVAVQMLAQYPATEPTCATAGQTVRNQPVQASYTTLVRYLIGTLPA